MKESGANVRQSGVNPCYALHQRNYTFVQRCPVSLFHPFLFMQVFSRSLLLPAFLLCAHCVFGQNPDTTANPIVSSIVLTDGDSVKYFVGKVISVKGKVVRVSEKEGEKGQNAYLEMFRFYPENPFNVPVFPKYRMDFEPPSQFEGKTVLLNGEVNAFSFTDVEGRLKAGVSIILRYREQIKILD